jgi:hypothetical protein
VVIATLAWAGLAKSSNVYTYKLTESSITVQHPIQKVYAVDYLKRYVGEMSIQYGLSPQGYQELVATIQCESNFQIDPKHNGISWGIAQFTKPTWNKEGIGDIMNPITQIEVMVRMWKNNQEPQWDCWCMKYGKDNKSCESRGL